MTDSFDDEIAKHDVVVGDAIWIGSEPTFTLRAAESPEWLSEPLGGNKLQYAKRMLAALRDKHPGSIVLRSVGRQYAAEEVPRWSLGLLERRNGAAMWKGPADPLGMPFADCSDETFTRFIDAIKADCATQGWPLFSTHCAQTLPQRLLISPRGIALPSSSDDPAIVRCSVHEEKTPDDGLSDTLAAAGLHLLAIGRRVKPDRRRCVVVELPACTQVDEFSALLGLIERAASKVALPALIFQGFPPPIDDSLAWMTVTPDPAVIEVNQAPESAIGRFLLRSRELFDVADTLGLSPFRLQYNGNVSDSGGGGQFTLGGASAALSPFFVQPLLLPRLVRYLNAHPALSYLFAPDYVGSASQSPRPDEGTRDAFHELAIALLQLERQAQGSPEFLWASLAPFLADPSGNAHRSELNIEKLWNPYLPGRGCLGLVEFRAFRMPYSAQRTAAIAALLRAVTAMLSRHQVLTGLQDWGDELHDRFALPCMLRDDLRTVFDDLQRHGFGLGPLTCTALLENPHRAAWTAEIAGCELMLERALEFWPLVGDVASQESGGSRTVDSSTSRLQISLRSVKEDAADLERWRLQVAGIDTPLRETVLQQQSMRLIGVRYRDFAPWRGLHPSIEPLGPVELLLSHPALDYAIRATVHNWQPQGLAYDGLPKTLDAAAQRREERLVVECIELEALPQATAAPAAAVSAFTLDLRLCDTAMQR